MNFNHENKSTYYVSCKDDLDRYKKILQGSFDFFPEINNKFEVYICKDFSCSLPVHTLTEIKELLD